MTAQLEQAIEKIAELTNAVKENGGLNGLRREDLIQDFTKALDDHKAALLDELPARRGEGFASSEHEKAVSKYNGKYAAELRNILKDGYHRIGNSKLTAADFWMAQKLLSKANTLRSQGNTLNGADNLRPVSDDLQAATKLMTATSAGAGDEYVPTGMATQLWNDMFAASRVVADLPTQPMPTDPFDIPLGLARPTWRKGSQGNASTAVNATTAKSTLTSTEQLVEIDWTYNLEEDAVIAMMPSLRSMLTLSGGEQMDAFALNADSTDAATGNINLDDANPDSDSYYLSSGQDGIRHLWLVDNTSQGNSGGGDALADADLIAGLNDLGKYGLNPTEVRIVPGISAYFAMLGLTNVATVDKYGPNATIVTGELMRYRGVPVIPSASHPLAEADGKVSNTAASNTLGTISLYNRNMWAVGFRRGLTIEVDRDIKTRQLIMVVSFRIAVGAQGTRSSADHTAGIYNFTV